MRSLWILALLFFTCCPDQPAFNYNEVGIASYYHDALEGNLTANGEVFSQDSMTAAHRTLPFGTKVKIYRPETDKSIWVRINDRGPFNFKRVIDLSKRAADSLGLISEGIGEVVIQAMVPESHANVGEN